jgi:hypothetical protein
MGAYESGEYEFSTTDFVLSTKWVTIPEAETATFTIMLSRDPMGTVEVTVAHRSGDTDITVDSGALLTFDSSNYTQPQLVTLKSAEDLDYLRGMALFLVSAPGLAPASIIAGESDNDETPPLYVDADAVGANDGSCWVDAFINLQDALSLARINLYIKQIRVAQGVYRPDRGVGITAGDQMISFELVDGVALTGAYAGFGEIDPNARDIKQYETILSGDLIGNDAKVDNAVDLSEEPTRAENTYRIANASDIDATTVFDGFTITGGNGWNAGAGMRNDSASTTISNCTFQCNSVKFKYDLEDGDWMVGEGGGLYNSRSNPTVIKCTFSANAAYWGGGMAQRWSNPILINCIFSDNYAIGAAIANEQNSNLRLSNCTFSGNSSGVIRNSGDSLELTNCIIWGNSGYSISNFNNRGTVTISYSNIQGGWLDTGNIAADPLFANPQKGDYHVKSQAGRWNPDSRNWIYDDVTSPCIDTGDPTSPIGPEPLPNGGIINMGAYGGTIEASKSP